MLLLFESSRKKKWKQNHVEDEVRGKARVRTIDKPDETCTNMDD